MGNSNLKKNQINILNSILFIIIEMPMSLVLVCNKIKIRYSKGNTIAMFLPQCKIQH